jgi:hypothetical protein
MFRSPGPLVYGTITVGAVLDAESTSLETFEETVAGVAIAMLVYWLAYSYAQVTAERVQEGEHLTLSLIADKMAREVSILTGAAVPLLVVVLWGLSGGGLANALSAGVWTSAAMIVLVNVVAAFEAKLTGVALVLQTAVGVVIGVGIIAMKLVFH